MVRNADGETAAAVAAEWNSLGTQIKLTEAWSGSVDGLIHQRCQLLTRIDQHVGRRMTLDHVTFFEAVADVLDASAHRAVLAVRVGRAAAGTDAASLKWINDHLDSNPGRPCSICVHACDPAEVDAIVLNDELREGGPAQAGECARYLWELWADAQMGRSSDDAEDDPND